MGFDSCHQALPDDWPPLRLARDDPGIAEVLQLTSRRLRGQTGRPRDPQAAPRPVDVLAEHVARLLRERPGIDQRAYDSASRSWDLLHYLLSPERRRLASTPRTNLPGDPGTVAARGASEVGPLAVATQGFQLRFSNAADVERVATFLRGITEEALREHFHPLLIEAAGVHRFWADRAEGSWPLVHADFLALRAVHLAAAEHGEGILVVID